MCMLDSRMDCSPGSRGSESADYGPSDGEITVDLDRNGRLKLQYCVLFLLWANIASRSDVIGDGEVGGRQYASNHICSRKAFKNAAVDSCKVHVGKRQV